MVVSKASNTTEATSSKTMGLIAQNLSTNGKGFVITEGLLAGLNTGSTVAGAPVWLGVDGNLIYGLVGKPYAPAHLVFIGIVTRANNSNGEIFVKVQNGFELDELHDVDLKSIPPTDGQVLQFDGATGLWRNNTLSTGLTVGSTAISSGTDGRVLFQNGGVLQQSANLFWDNTNSRLGIGTSSPAEKLHVIGNAIISGLGVGTSTIYNNSININNEGTLRIGNGEFLSKQINNLSIFQGKMIVANSGNVGIGTTSPTARLHIAAPGALSTDIAFRVRNSANTLDIIRAQGDGNVFVGLGAGNVNTGANNSFFGIDAGRNNTTGVNNTAIGESALRNNTTGGNNTANGLSALSSNTTGNSNIAIGWSALINNTTGNNNVAVGFVSLAFTSGSSGNTALGFRSGRYHGPGSINNLTAASNSIFIGFDAAAAADNQTNQIVIGHNAIGLGSNTAVIGNSSTTLFRPFGNVAIGADTAGARLDVRSQGALSTDIVFRVRNSADTGDYIRVLGNNNVFVGFRAGNVNTGNNVTAYGTDALRNNTSGSSNTAFGADALTSNTTAIFNTAVGVQALSSNTTGADNTAMGALSLSSNNATNNSAFGYAALRLNTSGGNNSAFGENVFSNNTTGSGNIAFGVEAGRFIADGTTALTIANNSVFLGRDTRAAADNQTNQIVIGHNAIGAGSNTVVLGNDSIVTTALKGNIGIGTTSPAASAKVQIDSNTQGFLPPRMTNAQRTAIASPAVGLMVYCTDLVEGLYVYKSMGWTFVI
jgi:hypothetical protein